MAVVASFQSGLMPAFDVGQSRFELSLRPDVCEARGMLPVTFCINGCSTSFGVII